MTRLTLALALAALLAFPATAAPRRRAHPVPVTIEGVGTVWVSARPPRQR